jgi:hypothetical protein
MPKTLDPFSILFISVAGWMKQRQQDAIEYLREDNCILRAQLGSRLLRFMDDQRSAEKVAVPWSPPIMSHYLVAGLLIVIVEVVILANRSRDHG